jgi:hypothetical protein
MHQSVNSIHCRKRGFDCSMRDATVARFATNRHESAQQWAQTPFDGHGCRPFSSVIDNYYHFYSNSVPMIFMRVESPRPNFVRCRAFAVVTLAIGAPTGCSGGSGGGSSDSAPPPPAQSTLSAIAQLGEKIFADPSLSESGRIACATCHDLDHALASPTNEPIPSGGIALDVPGFRNAPSLRYANLTPTFSFDSESAPVGGFDRDGRAPTLAEQARRPFLANGCTRLLRASRHEPRRVVSARCERPGPRVRRSAAAIRRERQRDGSPYNRHAGDQPALSQSEIADVIAFSQTLTDGYQP